MKHLRDPISAINLEIFANGESEIMLGRKKKTFKKKVCALTLSITFRNADSKKADFVFGHISEHIFIIIIPRRFQPLDLRIAWREPTSSIFLKSFRYFLPNSRHPVHTHKMGVNKIKGIYKQTIS